MGMSMFIRNTQLVMLGLSMVGIGCQQAGPLRLSVAADPPGGVTFVENKDAPYVNPVNLTLDDSPPGAMDAAVVATEGAFSTVFSPVVSPFVGLSDAGIRWIYNDRPSVADRMLEDRTNADNRREGMNKLVNFGFLKNEKFEARFRQMEERDSDYTVRATAIRTANRARDSRSTPMFINGLGDPNEWVRLEAAKALANVPDINAAKPLLDVLSNPAETRDVRVAAADALKHYRTLPVARALSGVLNDKTFVIAWQARRSLRYLTDRDYGYDVGAWLAYFTGTENPPG
jgi:hypothetical protein